MHPVDITPSPDLKTFFSRPDRVNDKLFVVTPIFNAMRSRKLWSLYQDFRKRVHEAGAILITVECAFGDRDFVVTQADDPYDVQVRTQHVLWLKENLIRIGVSRLPLGWRYLTWCDADMVLVRDDWADEVIHQLQDYPILQIYSQFQDLDPDCEVNGPLHRSFMNCHMNGGPSPQGCYPYGPGPHGTPGLAWACTREAWDALGGIPDTGILGSGDYYLANALVGRLDKVLRKDFHPRYRESVLIYQDRAERYIRGDVGLLKGLALHYFHGAKSKRGYGTRDEILVRNQFRPDLDLKVDWQGVFQLTDRSAQLKNEIRQYFRSRCEADGW